MRENMRTKILGCPIDKITMEQAVQKVTSYINEKNIQKYRHIITLNAEILYKALSDQKLKAVINQADLVTPDGSGIVWASKELGDSVPERVTGIDLMEALVQQANLQGWKLYFYGAAPGIAQLAAKNLQNKYKNLNIVGTKDGFISSDLMPELLADIKSKKPDILFVALGAPKQEFWINMYKDIIQVPVSIGVGGSFDVLAGKVKRAPKLFQKLHAEWLYRLIKEPWRYKRMMALPKFILKIMQEKRNKRSS
jgi:N-acetylglucosaminyldiphosphoundecaprenol N-acetyl-beta-D-mannosaminyltransferase